MKNKGTGNREQGAESTKTLLRRTIPPIELDPEPTHDLWPALQARLRTQAPLAVKLRSVPWFDWALAAGLAVFALVFPAAVPMLLYYL
ncbi:MAG: hypothetical protein WCF17_12270 [Terracidiphilus sp.]